MINMFFLQAKWNGDLWLSLSHVYFLSDKLNFLHAYYLPKASSNKPYKRNISTNKDLVKSQNGLHI